jgi:dienelactone hydrolase
MPPQGESTGIAIEDGVLIARILEQSSTKSIDQMFADYEKVRRAVIDKHYVDAERMAKFGFSNTTGLAAIAMEWITSAYMFVRKWNQSADFAGDVRELELPGEPEKNTK